ncbi:unnamed protein product [Sphagnum tenellum]
MAVSVGTPPRQFIVNIDTGIDLVWLNCKPCIQCIVNATDKPFDPTQSTSYREASCTDAACTGFPHRQSSCGSTGACGYTYRYGDGGDSTYTSGIIAYETFTFTALNGSSFAIEHITVGDVSLNIPADFFNINCTDGSGGIIFDSRTTLNLLIDVAYDAVVQEFASQYDLPVVSIPPYVCFNVSNTTASTIVPNIVFYLQSVSDVERVDFVLSLENVFLRYSETVECLTILSHNPPSAMIIGNTAQANHEMVFDRANGQIGWASTTCT